MKKRASIHAQIAAVQACCHARPEAFRMARITHSTSEGMLLLDQLSAAVRTLQWVSEHEAEIRLLTPSNQRGA